MEFIPVEVIKSISNLKQGEGRYSPFLPKLQKFVRHGNDAQLTVTTQPMMLRSIIGRRKYMLSLGPKIVKMLLMGLLDMKYHGLVMQNIQPSTIFLSHDGDDLHFVDVTKIAEVGEKQQSIPGLYLPYRYTLIKDNNYKHKALAVKDRYSVGIIILEILVGTEMVMAAQSEEQVE